MNLICRVKWRLCELSLHCLGLTPGFTLHTLALVHCFACSSPVVYGEDTADAVPSLNQSFVISPCLSDNVSPMHDRVSPSNYLHHASFSELDLTDDEAALNHVEGSDELVVVVFYLVLCYCFCVGF